MSEKAPVTDANTERYPQTVTDPEVARQAAYAEDPRREEAIIDRMSAEKIAELTRKGQGAVLAGQEYEDMLDRKSNPNAAMSLGEQVARRTVNYLNEAEGAGLKGVEANKSAFNEALQGNEFHIAAANMESDKVIENNQAADDMLAQLEKSKNKVQ